MTSFDILQNLWRQEGNIYSLIPHDCFSVCRWEDLKKASYAVMSYQWRSYWHSLVKFIDSVVEEFMWIDALCLDQMDPGKMATVSRSDEIYSNAKAYHIMELGSLFRGWVLFELSSVAKEPPPSCIHLTTKEDPEAISCMKTILSTSGFDGCNFTVESDREFVKNKIIEKHESVEKFNQKIIVIVNRIFV